MQLLDELEKPEPFTLSAWAAGRRRSAQTEVHQPPTSSSQAPCLLSARELDAQSAAAKALDACMLAPELSMLKTPAASQAAQHVAIKGSLQKEQPVQRPEALQPESAVSGVTLSRQPRQTKQCPVRQAQQGNAGVQLSKEGSDRSQIFTRGDQQRQCRGASIRQKQNQPPDNASSKTDAARRAQAGHVARKCAKPKQRAPVSPVKVVRLTSPGWYLQWVEQRRARQEKECDPGRLIRTSTGEFRPQPQHLKLAQNNQSSPRHNMEQTRQSQPKMRDSKRQPGQQQATQKRVAACSISPPVQKPKGPRDEACQLSAGMSSSAFASCDSKPTAFAELCGPVQIKEEPSHASVTRAIPEASFSCRMQDQQGEHRHFRATGEGPALDLNTELWRRKQSRRNGVQYLWDKAAQVKEKSDIVKVKVEH